MMKKMCHNRQKKCHIAKETRKNANPHKTEKKTNLQNHKEAKNNIKTHQTCLWNTPKMQVVRNKNPQKKRAKNTKKACQKHSCFFFSY